VWGATAPHLQSKSEEGKLQNSAQAGITFECFQLLAMINSTKTEEFINSLTKESSKPAYVYNYILGRRLAKIKEETVIAKAKTLFSEEVVNKALNPNG